MNYLRLSIPALILSIGAAIFVAGQREPAHAQGRRAIIWEHKVIEVAPGDRTELGAKLEKAGAEGWECVCLSFPTKYPTQLENTGSGYLILKRQR